MKTLTVRLPVAASLAALVVTAASGAALANVRDDQPTPIARGAHVSGVAQASSHQAGGSAAVGTASSCSTPGSTNYKTNCHGTGRPVETEPLWWPPAKIVGRYLTPFLAEHLGLSQEYPRPERTDAVPVEVELDTREHAWSAV